MNYEPAKRTYRQAARAQAAEATAERILEAFVRRLRETWFDEIRLEDVANDAGVTVQTVIRRFGGKDGLLDATSMHVSAEVQRRRAVAPGDVASAVTTLLEDYEAAGDLFMRMLAQEDRYLPVKRLTDHGRAYHRAWVRGVFSPWLEVLPPLEAEARLDALVVVTDVYVWKLLRRDMGRTVAELRSLMEHMIAAALEGVAAAPAQPSHVEPRHARR
jgi:AcrR family transcriptional regulator